MLETYTFTVKYTELDRQIKGLQFGSQMEDSSQTMDGSQAYGIHNNIFTFLREVDDGLLAVQLGVLPRKLAVNQLNQVIS